jgi:hypothetical protein
MYSTPLFSKLEMFSIGGFLGSKLPNPPAIATTLVLCIFPVFVITSNEPF